MPPRPMPWISKASIVRMVCSWNRWMSLGSVMTVIIYVASHLCIPLRMGSFVFDRPFDQRISRWMPSFFNRLPPINLPPNRRDPPTLVLLRRSSLLIRFWPLVPSRPHTALRMPLHLMFLDEVFVGPWLFHPPDPRQTLAVIIDLRPHPKPCVRMKSIIGINTSGHDGT